MHATELLHKIIGNSCQIDKRIIKTLFEAAVTLTRCRKLSIFGIARSLPRPIKVKNAIKCVDRLFGNETLHQKKNQIYKIMTRLLVEGNPRPVIVVDWSGLTRCGTYYFLRAAVTVRGRTITLYEQSYPIKEYANQKTHKNFLLTLQALLPTSCRPIIITDAGFRNTWFQLALSFGWDFIGRIRHNTQCKNIDGKTWEPIKNLYITATENTKYIGEFLLAKRSPLRCYFHSFKEKKKYREKRNLIGKKIRCSVSLKHAKGGNEPWLIATSINPEVVNAKKIVLLYSKRMQIEESFRDLKNTRNGLGLRHCRSHGTKRLDIALLIGALSMLLLWLIGMAVKRKNMQYDFQSNTTHNRNVLSVINIGWQALERRMCFTLTEIKQALQEIVVYAAN